ncbi:MAG: VWA domain-containing protein [Sulfurimonas sp.]
MHNFEFEYPFVFLLLLLIICIYKCPVSIKKFIFPHTHLFLKSTSWLSKERLFYTLIFTLLVTALASPITYDEKASSHRKGRDLVFVLDTSGSMAESGFSEEEKGKSKFNILKNIISKFISQRHNDNVGVSVFGTFAFSSVPLTYDMKAVKFLLDFLEVGIAGESTAIGDGIYDALKLLEHGEAKSKVIILITDGFHNSGSISPKDATKLAKSKNVKVYSIGIGKEGSYDKKLLKQIAQDSNAKVFEAHNATELENIYDELDLLEPSKIRSENYLNKHMLYTLPLLLASFLFLFILLKRKAS